MNRNMDNVLGTLLSGLEDMAVAQALRFFENGHRGL